MPSGWDYSSAQPSPFAGFTPTSTVTQARCNAIGQAGVESVPQAMMNEILKVHRVTPFSGKPEEFAVFAKGWKEYLDLLSKSNGQQPRTGNFCLKLLRPFLDPASAALLEYREAQFPHLDYYQFWDELCARHQKDDQAFHRRQWQQVELDWVNGQKLTLQKWDQYMHRYRAKRQAVQGVSGEDDYDQVYNHLPPHIKGRVKQELILRREKCYWVRATCRGANSVRFVVGKVANHIGVELPAKDTTDPHTVIIDCPSEAVKMAVLRWNRGTFQGDLLEFQPMEYKMTAD